MKNSRFRTLIISFLAALLYGFIMMLIVNEFHENVSVAFLFVFPLILGAIPVLFSTKEQLKVYTIYLLMPWIIIFTTFTLAYFVGFEGVICIAIVIVPFLLLGTIGAFITRLIKLKKDGEGNKLYVSLFLPLFILFIEMNFQTSDEIYSIQTSININANKSEIWQNIKNVKNIQEEEIRTHFVHLIGVPKPLNGELDRESIGGIRSITWEKGIRFREKITSWNNENGFNYEINVNPNSIPPKTLDEHVMIGGRYFDVLNGGYKIEEINPNLHKLTLSCSYRITTNLNFYAKLWADYMLGDFNEMILEIIKDRCEKQ